MIAPLLPKAEKLALILTGKIDHVLIDRMNYHNADWVYRKYRLEEYLADEYFARTSEELCSEFERQHIECQVIH
jgi:hypothetical protein